MSDTTNRLPPPTRAQNLAAVILTVLFLAFVVAGGWYLRMHRAGAPGPMGDAQTGSGSSALPTKTINGITISFHGQFRTPQSEIQIEFKNAQDQLVDVGRVRLTLDMNMPGMVMHDEATVIGKAGQYTAKIKLQMGGDWIAKLTYDGPQGSGQTSFKVSVK
jgi:hypothetical protein